MTRGKRIPDTIRATIAAAYGRGETSSNLGREHGVGKNTVITIAREYGVPINRCGPPPKPERAYQGAWVRDGLVWRPTNTEREAS